MASWKLTDKEWDALDRLRFSTGDAVVFRNATIILMSAVGRSKASIAFDLGCSIATVENVRQRSRQSGRDGLIPGIPSGRMSRATPEYRAALRTAVETHPQDLGYGFSAFLVVLVAKYASRKTGSTARPLPGVTLLVAQTDRRKLPFGRSHWAAL